MATIYLGGNFVSYEDPRFSHLSAEAREAAYFRQFEAGNLRELRLAPALTIVAGASLALLVLAIFLGDDFSGSKSVAGYREAARIQSLEAESLPQGVAQAGESRLVSNWAKLPMPEKP